MIEQLNQHLQKILDGEIDPLKGFIELKKLEAKLKEALTLAEPSAFEAASQWSEKTFKVEGAEIQKKNAAGKWDYSNIPQYSKAKERIKQIEELAKQAYAAKKSNSVIVDENGEVVDPPVYTEGRAIISVRLL